MFTHIVAESNYLEDFKDGSEYILRHLVEEYKEALQKQPTEEYLKKNKSLTPPITQMKALLKKRGLSLFKEEIILSS